MKKFTRFEEWIAISSEEKCSLAEVILTYEEERSQKNRQELLNFMRHNLEVMKDAVNLGLKNQYQSPSGLSGGDAAKLLARVNTRESFMGATLGHAAAYALGTIEINACMGKIVACPTAGSCGIVPGALLAAAEKQQADDGQIVEALFVAAGIGLIIEEHACIAGAQGGCQAECGTGASMAAGAVAYMAGGTPEQVGWALALAMKSNLGLVCDPVAGLVEVPCVKRNAFGSIQALLAADMALSGIASAIPADEVIDAMYRIGLAIPSTLKETSLGGLAQTPTGIAIDARVHRRH